VLVWRNDKLLLIERKRFPFGFAPVSGHIDKHGGFEQAAKNELKEEVGLDVLNLKLIEEGRKENSCRRGGNWHYWKIYEAEAIGEIKIMQPIILHGDLNKIE
jgi:ADP-ribose pyrophosphatase YjhB (NUDIX family)